MNRVVLVGRLTRDPELRMTPNGTPVCTFSIAVDRRFARRSEENGQPTADFIPIVTWQKTAEFCNQYFSKGRRIGLEGRIQTRNYEAKDGTKRYVTEVVADNVEFVDSKNSSGDNGGFNRSNFASDDGFNNVPAANTNNAIGSPIDDENIPF
ncbi:MAG: single-stranded DNA-binding protein [Selenomonadaceae bacterium]|nr:single-stranded DNA-binding protein [Selenomonadaceae bacterium]